MEFPRPQFTVRWLMIAVAIIALAFGLVGLWWRSATFRSVAEYHATEELSTLAAATGHGEQIRDSSLLLINRIGYHHKMSQKYWYACRYPWLPVSADPPEPDGNEKTLLGP